MAFNPPTQLSDRVAHSLFRAITLNKPSSTLLDRYLDEIHDGRTRLKIFTSHVVIYVSTRYKTFGRTETILNSIDDIPYYHVSVGILAWQDKQQHKNQKP